MNIQKTGEFIKSLRKEKNITQLELAEKLGCTDKAVSRWETGKGLPDADMLLSLSKIFRVSVNEILLGERFSFVVTDCKKMSDTSEDSKIEEIISHTDEAIVDILKDKEKEIVSINRSVIYLIALCCIQVCLFLFGANYSSMKLSNYIEVEVIYVLLAGSLINYILAGLIKDKCRWIFPLFVTLIWFFSGDYPGFMLVHGLSFGIPCVIIMGVISAVRYIVKKRKSSLQ